MKKMLASLIICLAFFANVTVLYANDSAKEKFDKSLNATAKETGHLELPFSKVGAMDSVSRLIEIALSLIGVLFLIFTIWGGFIWMNSRGEEQEVTRAKNIIRNSLIGLIIVIAAYAITNFIGSNVINQVAK